MARSYKRDRWRPYANGTWWMYVKGVDFTGSIEASRSSAKKWAKRNGYVVSTTSRKGRLFVKFVKEGTS